MIVQDNNPQRNSRFLQAAQVFFLSGLLSFAAQFAAAEKLFSQEPAAEQAATEVPAAAEPAAATWPVAWVTALAPTAGADIFAATAEGLLLRPASVVKVNRATPGQAEVLYEHPTSVWSVVATEAVVCSSDYKGNLAVWQREAGQMTMHEGVLQRWCRALQLAPDAQHLVAGNEAGNLFVWSLSESAVKNTKQLEAQQIFDIAFAPSGEMLAVCNGAGQVQMVSWPGLEPLQTVKLGEQPVWSLAFTADGTALLAGGADRKLWRVALGAEPTPQEIATTSDWITAIEAVPGGSGYVVASLDGKLLALDAAGQNVTPAGEVPSGVWTLSLPSADQMFAGTRKHAIAVLGRAWTVTFAEEPAAAQTTETASSE